jgi:hypothetical protein
MSSFLQFVMIPTLTDSNNATYCRMGYFYSHRQLKICFGRSLVAIP